MHQIDLESTEQGQLASTLRQVNSGLVYVATFLAGWFGSAMYSLAVLKGWV